MSLTERLKDGGYKSRKLWLVLWTQAQVMIFAGLVAKFPALAPSLSTVAGTLVGAAALFITGNVAAKHVLGKQGDTTDEVTVTESKGEAQAG